MLIFHVESKKPLPPKQLYKLKEIFDKFRQMNHSTVIVLLILQHSRLKIYSKILKVWDFLIFYQAFFKSPLLIFEEIFW